jgi:hypothetical protein
MLCGPAAKSACSRSIRAGCRHSNVLQSPTRARQKSASDLGSPLRTVEPTLQQGMLVCEQCRYALYRCSTRTSKHMLHYHRCLGSDGYRRLRGPVCTSRPIRQDYLDTFVWNEVIRLLDDPGLIQAEIDRRQEAARNADPFRKRQEELRRALIKSSSSEKDAIPPRSPRRCKKGRP